jgi:hypothetical protein
MTFKLLKKAVGATLTKFHVLNSRGDICGSINVGNGEVNDLLKCSRDSAPATSAVAKQTTAVNAMVAAFKRGPRLNKQAILRGC